LNGFLQTQEKGQQTGEKQTNNVFANFQPPSQKTTGKGLEVNVKRSYKEQLTEPGHILQQSRFR